MLASSLGSSDTMSPRGRLGPEPLGKGTGLDSVSTVQICLAPRGWGDQGRAQVLALAHIQAEGPGPPRWVTQQAACDSALQEEGHADSQAGLGEAGSPSCPNLG